MQQFKLIAIALFVGVFIQHLQAQNVPVVGYFNASTVHGKVYLSWQLNAGATCLGTQIERSIDGITFSEIGKIGGICGDLSKPVSYSFTDEDPPLNEVVFYRLELGLGNFTDTLRLEVIDLGSNAYQIRPNPVRESTTIYFSNESQENYTLRLMDLSGKLLHRRSTNQSRFVLNYIPFPTGMYLFAIQSEDSQTSFNGKLMIVR
ncbi:MAG: T9SS type A sorting domain-containing protein [Bacteroidetes bacterium]|nr:T9SS type A sorting domain-containing protein [Bacteroidota bacterium]